MASANSMAKFMEKAVADKMGKGRATKQKSPRPFPKSGTKAVAMSFSEHGKNKKKIPAKRGTTR